MFENHKCAPSRFLAISLVLPRNLFQYTRLHQPLHPTTKAITITTTTPRHPQATHQLNLPLHHQNNYHHLKSPHHKGHHHHHHHPMPPPSHPPVKPPTSPPVKPPTHPPVKPPTSPPVKPPTPPVKPPTHTSPPVKPPTPPVKPPTPPVKPPTPPVVKPPTPPVVKPPTPPVKPPTPPVVKPPTPPVKPPTPPVVKPPSHPPVKPPPPTRKAVAVQGVVYCKSCKYRGVGTLIGASPLAGAVVKLQCNNTKWGLVEQTKTDKNGYFLFKPAKLTTAAFHKCKVFLISSPLATCSVPTNMGNGAFGAILIPSRKPPVKPLPFQLFTVGPFAFEPAKKVPCHL
ncbi:unnamed protein product [Fraxinus pennsylvanica]|uniref:Uncharacterized protein n=1 Tax=Fraxinus pennsylvanica TaxID=56036 RepID=A0AAD1YZ90_9LAMI|nr:unnamed protein product [Fraxinus pennsylvanica]